MKLNFSYNSLIKVKKATNTYSTKVFEYNLSEADKEAWEKFEAIIESNTMNFDVETEYDTTEVKLEKFYKHLERATAIVFEKKKEFTENEDNDKEVDTKQPKSKNKIPRQIRNLLKKNQSSRDKFCPQHHRERIIRP